MVFRDGLFAAAGGGGRSVGCEKQQKILDRVRVPADLETSRWRLIMAVVAHVERIFFFLGIRDPQN